MPGLRDLDELLRALAPVHRAGEFVFVSSLPEGVTSEASVRETEGWSYVIRREDADDHRLGYDFVAAWIELRVHSALDAVGLTAAVAAALADAGLGCNVIAGLRHDHLLVPVDRVGDALEALVRLSVR